MKVVNHIVEVIQNFLAPKIKRLKNVEYQTFFVVHMTKPRPKAQSQSLKFKEIVFFSQVPNKKIKRRFTAYF